MPARWAHRVVRAALPLVLQALGAVGCSDSSAGSTAPPVVTMPSPPADGGATSEATGADLVDGPVARSDATRALVAFVAAHADSVNAGAVTDELRRLSGAAELRRQRRVVAFAAQHGYVVPDVPRVAVVSATTPTAGTASLGVCLWLPSTEYVDADTGQPPSGPVPERWVPAVATLSEGSVTWMVDMLTSPDNISTVNCRGLT